MPAQTAEAGQHDVADVANPVTRSGEHATAPGLNFPASRTSQRSASRLAWAGKRLTSSGLVLEPVTRVVRWSGPDAVVRVTTRAETIVAIPRAMPSREVLDLASLVLSAQEHQELQRRFAPGQSVDSGARASAGRKSGRWHRLSTPQHAAQRRHSRPASSARP